MFRFRGSRAWRMASPMSGRGAPGPIHQGRLMSRQMPEPPIRSVSKAAISPPRTSGGPHSWNRGFVRGPEE